MKTIKLFTYVAFALCLGLASCSTDAEDGMDGAMGAMGAQGPAGQDGTDGTDGQDGQDGEDGEDGEDGNANVIYSEWTDIGFSNTQTSTAQRSLFDGVFTEDVQNTSAVLIYSKLGNGNIVALPYTESYIVCGYVMISSTDSLLILATTTGDETFNFSVFDQVRYVIIPPADTRGQENDLQQTALYYKSLGLDLSNYDEVAAYFHIEN